MRSPYVGMCLCNARFFGGKPDILNFRPSRDTDHTTPAKDNAKEQDRIFHHGRVRDRTAAYTLQLANTMNLC